MTRIQSLSHVDYDEAQPWRLLCLRVIEIALYDSRGINLSYGNKCVETQALVMADAVRFFYDGRYAHMCEIVDLDPTVLPPAIGAVRYYK